MILAKGLGSGYPISAVAGSPELMNLGGSRIGGTYVGNPVACAAANATLGVIEDEGGMDRAAAIERMVTKFWEDARADIPEIGDIRGLGAMMAVEFVTDPETKEPNPELVNADPVRRRPARPGRVEVRPHTSSASRKPTDHFSMWRRVTPPSSD